MKTKTSSELIIKRIESLFNQKSDINSYYSLAKKSKITEATLYSIHNRPDIRFSTVRKVCKAFDMTIQEFFDDDIFNCN